MIKSGKEYLEYMTERINALEERNERDKERIETIQANMISVNSVGYDERVQSTPEGDRYSTMIDEILSLQEHMRLTRESIKATKDGMKRYLDRMGNNQLEQCLIYRHIDGMSVGQICIVENITDRGLRKRFKRAYDLFEAIYALEMFRKK